MVVVIYIYVCERAVVRLEVKIHSHVACAFNRVFFHCIAALFHAMQCYTNTRFCQPQLYVLFGRATRAVRIGTKRFAIHLLKVQMTSCPKHPLSLSLPSLASSAVVSILILAAAE